ncbi:UDP-N-acetylmuramoylalanine--D-glutamate ligase, partial [Pseudolycoriella hygida]
MLQVTSFLDIVYSWNYGISFGLFRNYYQYSNMLFMVLNSAIIAYLWGILMRATSILGFVGYSFVVGGAVGNLIDRFINGAVFDFIYLHYKEMGFPVFNLADSFISLGVIILLYDYYQTKKFVEQKNTLHYNDAVIHQEAERIRIVTPGPNEYLVKRNKPLEVPPHYELPLVKKTTDKGGNKGTAASLNAGEEALIEEYQKIGIFGLGKTGTSSYEALVKVAEVICYDQNSSSRESFTKVHGRDSLVDLSDFRWKKLDKILLSPGVPLSHDIIKLAGASNIPITSDIELLFEECSKARFIAVTGTNGKSTTVSLIGHILQANGINYPVGGNIGIPALSIDLNALGYVLELSSFQLDLLQKFKAKIAVLLNITKDHLDRHGTMENYIAAKRKIFERLDKECFAIISVDNNITDGIFKQLSVENKTNLIPISTCQILDKGVSIYQDIIYDNLVEPLTLKLSSNKCLQGIHNQENIAASYATCRVLGILPTQIATALQEFKGLPHRMQYIGTIYSDKDGLGIASEINFYNDSKATNVDAAYQSLSSFDNIYWLAGGVAKEANIKVLEPLFPKICRAYLFGQDKEVFVSALKDKVQFQVCDDLIECFNKAVIDSKKDGGSKAKNILLAPACASLDQFKNFEERGELFIKLYNQII